MSCQVVGHSPNRELVLTGTRRWSLGILIYEMLCGYTPFWDSGSPMRIYENILKGKVKYPAYIVPEAQNLLECLITADLTKRLGNLYGGPSDVKNHKWFAEVTWDRLARKDIDAPYTPPVKAGTGDASQFDKYPEEAEKYGTPGGNDEYVVSTPPTTQAHDMAACSCETDSHVTRYGHLFVDF
jgi:serine/threonine protein kinase